MLKQPNAAIEYIEANLCASEDSQNSNMVDTIVRTSAASIFGYFISSNFAVSDSEAPPKRIYDKSANISAHTLEDDIKLQQTKQVGFAVSSDLESGCAEEGDVSSASFAQTEQRRLQIIIVSSVGLCALILLSIAKFFVPVSLEVSVAISQLRDFVSACIGFLVSFGRAKR